MKSLHHSFDVDLAAKYGVHEAILIHHFQHWIRFNKNTNRNFKDGKWWSYQTLSDMAAHFPYFTVEDLRGILEYLCTGKGRKSKKSELDFAPVLVKGNFNKAGFDRTTWYAFVDEEYFLNNVYEREISQIDKGGLPIGNGRSPTPIPDTKTDTKDEDEKKERGASASAREEFVYHKIKMPQEKYQKLIEDFGEERVKIKLEALHERSLIKAKKFNEYTDHALVLRKWLREDGQNESQSTEITPLKQNGVQWKGKKLL